MNETAILARAAAAQRGRNLEYFTIAWNAIEGLLAIALGAIAGSISLKNGWVCMVKRGWEAMFDNPEFWNPKVRAADCLNPPAARSVLPYAYKRTEITPGRPFQARSHRRNQISHRQKQICVCVDRRTHALARIHREMIPTVEVKVLG